MHRPRKRTLSLLALATLGFASAAIFFGAIAGGCVFGSPTPPVTEVCGALGGYFQSCPVSSACSAAYSRDCDKVSTALSSAAINALFLCAQNGQTCGDAGTAVLSACVTIELKSQPASAAQLQLASDYCRACAPTVESCATDFYQPTGPAGSGLTALSLSGDETVQKVDSACTPHLPTDAGAAACDDQFRACALPIATAGFYLPPECVSDAGLPLEPADGG